MYELGGCGCFGTNEAAIWVSGSVPNLQDAEDCRTDISLV
jgi:hypothetical protein